MKAAQIDEYGKDALHVAEAPKPSIRPSQALVEVAAAGVNPFDVKVRDGLVRDMAELRFPATLGGDVAGTVIAIGEEVKNFKPGQAVYGQANALGGQGAFAEVVAVDTEQLALKPSGIDFVTAAALPLVACSAYRALVDHMNLQPGQKVLIHGGAGGIGSIAIQLAKHLGAYVATTASAPDADFVTSLGADEVIDYRARDFAAPLKDYDAAYDTIGGKTNRKSYDILKPGGILVSMVEQPDEALVKKRGIRYVAQFTHVTTEYLTKVSELVDTGKIKVTIDRVFPLKQAAEALEYLKTSHNRGKVVIQVKE
jgi:NADPH:quinone reductase-like Zn-dependent oxidoreductase